MARAQPNLRPFVVHSAETFIALAAVGACRISSIGAIDRKELCNDHGLYSQPAASLRKAVEKSSPCESSLGNLESDLI
jgi:hypothetical protein